MDWILNSDGLILRRRWRIVSMESGRKLLGSGGRREDMSFRREEVNGRNLDVLGGNFERNI